MRWREGFIQTTLIINRNVVVMNIENDVVSVAISETDDQRALYLIGKISSESFRVIDQESWNSIGEGRWEQVDPDVIKDLQQHGFVVNQQINANPQPQKKSIVVDWESNTRLTEEISALSQDKSVDKIILKSKSSNASILSNIINTLFPHIPYLFVGKLRIHYTVDKLGDTSILSFAKSLPIIRHRRVCVMPIFTHIDDISGFANFEIDLLMDLDALGNPINLFEIINHETCALNIIDRMLLAYSLNGTGIVHGGSPA